MRLKRFLQEQDGCGGEGMAEVGTGATTTDNVEKYWSKMGSKPARRFKKKKRRMFVPETKMNDNIIQDLCDMVLLFDNLNEAKIVPDFLFNNIKKVGSMVGLNIKRSDSLIDYVSSAEAEIQELFNLLCLYILAPKEEKPKMKAEIKAKLKKVNTRRLAAFFMLVDKMAFGMTSIIRHLLIGVFGVEISTYNKWSSDISYILSHLEKIKSVLMSLSPTQEEIDAFNHFYDVVVKTKEEIESRRGY